MPIDSNNDKHVVAPVGLATVAKLLGEARTDAVTLCCSAKINPYSLIRPLYRKTETPGTAPSWFANSANYNANNLGLVVPPAMLADIQPTTTGGTQSSPLCSGLGAAKDYVFTTSEYLYHSIAKWGYVVPYVTTENAIFALTDDKAVWKRFGPGDVLVNGKLTDCWAEVQQFDGYIHDTEPVPPMTAVQIEYGKPITYTPNVSVGRSSDTEVLGTTGKAHPGGIVSIPAVLGVDSSYKYGMTVFWRAKSTDKYTRLASYLGGLASGDKEGLTGKPILGAVGFGSAAKLLAVEGEYIIVPWVATGVSVDASTGKLKCSGAKFYSFRFGAGFDGFVRRTVEMRKLEVNTYSTAKLVNFAFHKNDQSNAVYKVSFNLENNWKDYPMTARDFLVHVSYKQGTTTTNLVLRTSTSYQYDLPNTYTYQSLSAADDSETFGISFGANGTADGLSVTMDGARTGPIGWCGVKIYVPVPFDATDVMFLMLAYRSVDNNPTFGLAATIKVKYTDSIFTKEEAFKDVQNLIAKE